jgi:ACS family sodium-dependent inorganic phosphate cotransporter
MSIAIVSMTNHSAIQAEVEVFDDECPETVYDNSTDHSHQDGSFAWSTKTQGWVLSSFFYGYVLTQVGLNFLQSFHPLKIILIFPH